MNRSFLLGLVGGVAFVLALIAGVVVADAMRDHGGGEVEVPTTVGGPIPLLPAHRVGGEGSEIAPDATGDYVEIEVAGEVYRLDGGPGGIEDSGTPVGGGSVTEVPVADDAPDDVDERGYSWDVPPLSVDFDSFLFGDLGWGLLRWLDFCADNPASPTCPFGVGGTVLAPFDDSLSVGDFRVGDLYTARADWWKCPEATGLGDTQHHLMVYTNHPARLEITYRPVDDPTAARSVVVDHRDPTDDVFRDFIAEAGGAEVFTGIHNCFVLQADNRSRVYDVVVEATSFTEETDSRAFQFQSPDLRARPPVGLDPRGDYETMILVPVRNDEGVRSVVRLIRPEEGLACSEIEDAVLEGGRREVLPRQEGQPHSFFLATLAIAEVTREAADYRYDPEWDAYDYWQVSVEEGQVYRLCVWWLRSDGVRSFDPASAAVIERETRRISTPDHIRVAIDVAGIQAPSEQSVAAESFTLRAPSHCTWQTLPFQRIEAGRVDLSPARFCDYLGYAQPDETVIEVRFGDGSSREFAITTPNTGVARVEQVMLDLSSERSSGLCGGSFGSCDPPTTTYPGARVFLDVHFYEGDSNGSSGWVTGLASGFDPPPRDPEEMPVEIRIDTISSGVTPRTTSSVAVTANFDRPVTLTAVIDEAWSDDCFVGPPPSYTSDVQTARYSFVLEGLCPLSDYYVDLEATDAAGTTTVFEYHHWEPESHYYPGGATTPGYEVEYVVSPIHGFAVPVQTFVFDVTINGQTTRLIRDDYCLSGFSDLHSGSWGDVVEVEIHVRLGGNTRLVDGQCGQAPGSRTSWEASVVTSFTIEELRSGSVVIPVPLETLRGLDPPTPGSVLAIRLIPNF